MVRHNNVPNPLFIMAEEIHGNMTCALRMGCPLSAVVARVMNLVDKFQTYGHMTDISMMNQNEGGGVMEADGLDDGGENAGLITCWKNSQRVQLGEGS